MNRNGLNNDYCNNSASPSIISLDPFDSRSSRQDHAQIILSISGDRRAFERLYCRWQPRWLRFATWIVRNPDDALDVTQEASVAIARNIHRLKDPALFKAWSFTIVRRRAADHVRGAVNARRLAAALLQDSESQSSERETCSSMADLLALVDTNDQHLLALFYVYGLSVAELASVLEIPAGTVKSRLFHARGRLQRAYELELEGEHHE